MASGGWLGNSSRPVTMNELNRLRHALGNPVNDLQPVLCVTACVMMLSDTKRLRIKHTDIGRVWEEFCYQQAETFGGEE